MAGKPIGYSTDFALDDLDIAAVQTLNGGSIKKPEPDF